MSLNSICNGARAITYRKSTESKGDSLAESTQTAEIIEKWQGENCGTKQEGWNEVGEGLRAKVET